jgi:DNA-binding transcriptional ArsR family regulator
MAALVFAFLGRHPKTKCGVHVSSPNEMSLPIPCQNVVVNMAHPISSVGELIAEPARTAILLALLDGRSLTAGELAMIAGVSPQSASAHLSKLIDGALLAVRNHGRHRYYSITGPEVVYALEALGAIATRPRPAVMIHSRESVEMYRARSCYDHLAGRVAVELTKALENSRVIQRSGERDYELGPQGRVWFGKLEIDVDALQGSRRSGRSLICQNAGGKMVCQASRLACAAHHTSRLARTPGSLWVCRLDRLLWLYALSQFLSSRLRGQG